MLASIENGNDEKNSLGQRGSEARVRGMLAALPDMMFIVSKDLVFEEYQAPDPDRLFMPPSDFLGRRVDEVLPPHVATRVADAVLGTLDDGERRTVPYSYDLPEGRQWFEAISGLCDEDSVLFVVRDRTREVLTEERLRMADRMASLGMLASGVAHEINNPLTYVLGNLDFLRQALEQRGDEEMRDAFADVEHGLEQVKALIGDLRVFSHPVRTELTAVDLSHVLEATLRIAKGALSRHASLVYEPSELPPISGNASQVGQVVLNLVTNALDAMATGDTSDNELRIETHHVEDRVVLAVSDTGVGIPPELRERIFDPFITDKAVGQGSGLGLAICRSIVESLGGTIQAKSRAPRGTTVTVTFARFGPRAPAPIDYRLDEAEANRQEARILIVDDDERVGQVTARALRDYEVVTVLNGAAALGAIRGPDPFDLVLCDLMMPGMTGMELYRAVANESSAMARRFVFMTGAAFSTDARSFVESTARPLLQKPFHLEAVRAMVAEQLQ